MKDYIYTILIWFSGADRNTLDTCSKSEHIKYGGYGVLVLIPAVVGTISMSYAISTLSKDPLVFFGIGLAWGVMVLFIDRFIVATFKKSDKIWEDIRSITFILRFIFAVGIGIIVSHPLVMFFFDESIKQQISTDKRNSVALSYKTVDLTKDTVNIQLNERTKLRDCLQKLLTAEQSGVVVSLECGFSSGIKECGKRCDKIQGQIDGLNSEIKILKQDNNPNIIRLDSLAKTNEKDILLNFSEDYIARVEMLAKIEDRSSHVKNVKWFLILFFIFLDILPVTFKVVTRIGEYDLKVREQEKKKVAIIGKQINRETEVEVGLIEKLFKLRSEKIDSIFSQFRNGTLKELIHEIGKILDFGYPTVQSQGNENQPNTAKNENVPYGKFYELLDSKIVVIFFIIFVLLLEYYALNYYYGDNKDKWTVIMPLVITITLPLLQQIVPARTQS